MSGDVLSAESGSTALVTQFSWSYLSKLSVALASVLLIFMLFAWIMRRHTSLGDTRHQGLEIVASLSLGQRERIIVVQAGKQQVLLGITQAQINQLMVLDDPLSPTEMVTGLSFRSNLEQLLQKDRK